MAPETPACPDCGTRLHAPLEATCPVCGDPLPLEMVAAFAAATPQQSSHGPAALATSAGAPSDIHTHQASATPFPEDMPQGNQPHVSASSGPATAPPSTVLSKPLQPVAGQAAALVSPGVGAPTMLSKPWPGAAGATHIPTHTAPPTPNLPASGLLPSTAALASATAPASIRPAPPTVPLASTPWPNAPGTAGSGGRQTSSPAISPALFGNLVRTHRGSNGRQIAGLIFFGIVAVVAVAGASSSSDGTAGYWTSAISAAIAVSLLIVVIVRSGQSIQLYENGLVDVRGSSQTRIRYDDIKNFWYRAQRSRGASAANMSMFTIETIHGQKHIIYGHHYGDSEGLGKTLLDETTTRLLPKALTDLRAGKTLYFGPISLTTSELSNGRETIPWSDVSGARLTSGSIVINKRGKWLTWSAISTATTPNVAVLLLLVHAIVGVTAP